MLPKTATVSNEFVVKFSPFHKVECCLDIVAALAKMLPVSATTILCSFEVHFVEKTKFRSMLWPKPAATLLPKTATMSKQHSTMSKE